MEVGKMNFEDSSFDEEERGTDNYLNTVDVTADTTIDGLTELEDESSSGSQPLQMTAISVFANNTGSKKVPPELEEPFNENEAVVSNTSSGKTASPVQEKRHKLIIALVVLLLAGAAGCILAFLSTGSQKNTKNSSDALNNDNGTMESSNVPSALASAIPSNLPSSLPSASPTQGPSTHPSLYPSANPTSQSPSVKPSLSLRPSTFPSAQPTPVASMAPSEEPTTSPSAAPSLNPTSSPSDRPSLSQNPTLSFAPSLSQSPTLGPTEAIFFVIGDAPYTQDERNDFPSYIQSIPEDADFAIHLGDIKPQKMECSEGYNKYVAKELLKSPVPMFIVVGDNEFNDCANPTTALTEWKNVFQEFESNWDHRLNIVHPPERPETFTFIHKSTLYIGTNLPGGQTCCDWTNMMRDQATWTIDLIRTHTDVNATAPVDGVVIFGHASPGVQHALYFETLQEYVRYELKNKVPMLYLCADSHVWMYEPNYYNEYNFLRIRITGGTEEPPLKMIVDPATHGNNPSMAFRHERFWN